MKKVIAGVGLLGIVALLAFITVGALTGSKGHKQATTAAHFSNQEVTRKFLAYLEAHTTSSPYSVVAVGCSALKSGTDHFGCVVLFGVKATGGQVCTVWAFTWPAKAVVPTGLQAQGVAHSVCSRAPGYHA